MLKLETDFIREFPQILRTSRDAENPLVVEFIKSHPDIESLLDVGAHNSWKNYAPEIRELVKHYDGIDILPNPETAQIIDNYFVDNANTKKWARTYDAVICVSVFEHCGISTYKGDARKERLDLFKKCLDLADKYVWVSFDCGQEYLYPDQLSPITKEEVLEFEELTKGYKVKKRFLYTQGCQSDHPWYEHTKEDVALKIPYIDFVGNQSVAVFEIDKT